MATINVLFDCAGYSMTRIWHCFGNIEHRVDLQEVGAMLNASQTNVLPINTHNLTTASGHDGLVIGFGDVSYQRAREAYPLDAMVKMLNINHNTTVERAVEKTLFAHELTGERIVKLEVLNEDLRTSNDALVVEAVRQLRKLAPQLVLLPLISTNVDVARELVALECRALRVMGSGIGHRKGILDTASFARICKLPVPVVLDGGVGNARHFAKAVELGAAGALVNSMLFESDFRPSEVLAQFMMKSAPVLRSFSTSNGGALASLEQ